MSFRYSAHLFLYPTRKGGSIDPCAASVQLLQGLDLGVKISKLLRDWNLTDEESVRGLVAFVASSMHFTGRRLFRFVFEVTPWLPQEILFGCPCTDLRDKLDVRVWRSVVLVPHNARARACT